MKKIEPLVYPFTFEQWQQHPSNVRKIAWCKKIGAQIDKIRLIKKTGTQLKLEF